jgi:hypothetical protein
VNSHAVSWISLTRIGRSDRSSTSVTVSSTGLALAGAGRGSRGLTSDLRSNSSWSAPSRASSTSSRGFERASFNSKRFERAPLSTTESVTFKPLRAASEFVSVSAYGSTKPFPTGGLPRWKPLGEWIGEYGSARRVFILTRPLPNIE